jgi:hypothetical protein
MTLICAWCGKTLRRGRGPVSHGICESCSLAVQASLEHWNDRATGDLEMSGAASHMLASAAA